MHRSRHTGVPRQAWKALRLGSAFPVGAVWTWLETYCCDVCGRAGPAAPHWEMEITFRCISHAYCATQRHQWWKAWLWWAVGSDAVAASNLCSWTKGILQGKFWKQLIFRDRLEFSPSDHSLLPGGSPHWLDLTANFFHEKQPGLPPWTKATGWDCICSTDPASVSLKRIRQTNKRIQIIFLLVIFSFEHCSCPFLNPSLSDSQRRAQPAELSLTDTKVFLPHSISVVHLSLVIHFLPRLATKQNSS